ncbi:MAG TPA: MFS transporter [Conexibacter sp.]
MSSRKLVLTVLLGAPFLAQADATIANVATPSIHAELGASGGALELVVGGYLIAFAVLVITGARLGQTHGYRRVFLVGAAIFTAASLACGLAPDPVVLVLARVLQGTGAALMFPQALTGIQRNFSGARQARALALYAIALSSGAVAGQVLGGVVIDAHLTGEPWRAIFLVNVPVGMVLLLAAARWLPADDVRVARRTDVAGITTLSLCLLLVIVPLVLGRAGGWPAWTWICLAASVPALAAFLAVERRLTERNAAPLVNLYVIGRPATAWALGAMLAATGTYYALLFTFAQYVQTGLGRGPLVSGLALVPWVAAFGLAGQVVRRLPSRAAAASGWGGCALLGSAYLAIGVAERSGAGVGALLVMLLMVGGLGLGLQFSGLLRHLTTTVPPRFAPDISGVSTTVLQIGGALGVAAFGGTYLKLASQMGPADAFADVTSALAVVALLAAAMAYRCTHVPRPRPSSRRHTARRPDECVASGSI